jgi:endonuclease/exonuclease/phosphatase family metal-dependent hydrolase
VAVRRLGLTLAAGLAAGVGAAEPPPPAPGSIRIATYNAALSRPLAGALVQEMRLGGSAQIDAAAAVIRAVHPDILLINELDQDPRGVALELFAARLAADGFDYPHRFAAQVNTGEPTGFDLDGDGDTDGPRDAYGYGLHPGHYGMAILSRFPLGDARSFRLWLWADTPGALIPEGHFPDGFAPRLSSKAHWDVTAQTPLGPLSLLVSHPTPPVFDGPEDLNGRRNADEIGFWAAYLSGEDWMMDDTGRAGGAGPHPAVVMGDLNADPADGDGRRGAIRALLSHPRLQDPRPRSPGGAAAVDAGHAGDPALDTADWRFGALRVDYVLPDARLRVTGAGVFWPAPGDPMAAIAARASDHRLVWVDVALP